jgi:hypothetical protein
MIANIISVISKISRYIMQKTQNQNLKSSSMLEQILPSLKTTEGKKFPNHVGKVPSCHGS